MARRNRYNRKRRRGGFSLLYKFLTFMVICAAIAVALTLFFKVEEITVTGNNRYSQSQIVTASGIKLEDNMFFMNKYQVSDNITSALPYIETVQIRRALPDGLIIAVRECSAPAAITYNGKAWLLSAQCKVVDSKPAAAAKDYAHVLGLPLTGAQVGSVITVAEEHAASAELLQRLLTLLAQKNMLAQVQQIDLGDGSLLTLRYLDRFDVTLRRDADLDYKLDYLLAVVERLEVNEKGRIDMTQEDKASFIPQQS